MFFALCAFAARSDDRCAVVILEQRPVPVPAERRASRTNRYPAAAFNSSFVCFSDFFGCLTRGPPASQPEKRIDVARSVAELNDDSPLK